MTKRYDFDGNTSSTASSSNSQEAPTVADDAQLTLADATKTSFYGCFPAGYGRPW